MINTKRDRKNLFVNLNKINLVKKLDKILGVRGGYHARTEDGKFIPNFPSTAHDPPWVYVKIHPHLRCDIYHGVIWKCLKFIPSTCRSCWKIVCCPRSVVELFDLYELQREMGVPCKCGIERRRTDTRLYGGYFYTQSYEEGMERYKQVRQAIDEQISPDMKVFLKRYCSEYEIGDGLDRGQGPSNQLPDLTPDELELEKYILDQFPPSGHATGQPDHIIAHVMMEWIHYAYKHGDPTYTTFTDGSPLFPSAVTYHDTEQQGVIGNATYS